IARAVRESSGGLPAVKALGLEVDGQAQLSMNLVDIEVTSLSTAYAAVEREAHARGSEVRWSEIIGLVPERVAFELTSKTLKLRDDIATHVLERRLLAARSDQSLTAFIASVASASPVPGGGSVAAIAGALAAALASMVAELTAGRDRYAAVRDEMRGVADRAGLLARNLELLSRRDAEAYAGVVAARNLPTGPGQAAEHREGRLRDALVAAAAVPLEVCRACEEVARLSEIVGERGNSNAITDAGVAAALANAGCLAAAYNVRINVRDMTDATGAAMRSQAIVLAESTAQIATRVAATVEAAL
ncbi:MAG: cyclodeaminase/cyclohydrolase family protein, partial [Gemmatimonadales bacterium]